MSSETTSSASADSIDEHGDRALRDAAAVAPFGVFDIDLVANRTWWSPELFDILARPRDGVTGAELDVPSHVHAEDRQRVEAAIRRAHDPAGDGRVETEHRIVRGDGQVRWVLVKGRTLFDDVGGERRATRALGIMVDITERKAAEDHRFKTLLAESGQILWTADASGRIAEGADSWRKFTGREVDRSEPLGWADALHPDDRERALSNWAAALANATPIDAEVRLRHASGEWRWVRARALPLLHDDGEIRCWIGVITDITERKNAELEARRLHDKEREASALLDAIFASAPIGMAVWDRDLRLQRINAGLAEMNGLPVDAHIGKRLPELLPGLEDLDELERLLRQVLETGEPSLNVEVRGETPAKPGEKRSWKEDFFPLRVRGDVVGLAAVVQETTERRAAEAQLRESEARFRQMADNAPFMVWVTSPDCACTFLSRSWYEFTGQSTSEALGQGWCDALHPDDRAGYRQAFRAAQERREPFRVELRVRRHDGEYRWVINAATPRFGPGRRFKGYIGSIIDITERKLAEQALENADRQKDEFLAMLAHELRNPLAPMRTALELMGRLLPEDDRLRDLRRTAERQLHHLTRLVDDLLDTSRITTGKIVLKTERLDLRGVIRHSLETSGPLLASRGHKVVTRLPEGPLDVDGDAVRLSQIVTNLLNNAAKFTPSGGRIELDLERDAGEATIRVRDNGIGIAPEALPKLFDRSMRVDDARGDEGLGLGLSLVKRLAELHGGSVAAHSDGLGRGSEFVVRLPLSQQHVEAA
ncbi:MAG: PAS domain S-box protein, partial [Gammaproteobacteria bacterium]|nr:PAS domain S-box protein [Gammaproteobacteria bacterium]